MDSCDKVNWDAIARTFRRPDGTMDYWGYYDAHIKKTDTCWFWRGGTWSSGHGMMYFKKKLLRAEDIMYERVNGKKLVKNAMIKQTCGNQHCVNPEHFAVTCKSECNSRAKLTLEQAREIRKKYSEGITQVELAKQYNISLNTLVRVLKNISYKNIHDE